MKKSIYIILLYLLLNSIYYMNIYAAYLQFIPQTVTQSDGSKIECFATGDEFNNFLHTKEGYSIINDNGIYVFAERIDNELKPTKFRVDSGIIPKNIKKWEHINTNNSAIILKNSNKLLADSNINRNKGIINNIVIFVHFNDELDFLDSASYYNNIFNSIYETSLRNYYYEVSYGKLIIKSYLYPIQDQPILNSYKSKYKRDYYLPYSTTNNIGYKSDEDKEIRKLELFEECLRYASEQISKNINFDYNNDNKIDNITLIIKGAIESWGGILWSHQFKFTQNKFNKNYVLNNKVVDNCIIIPEEQLKLGVLCHEFFHSLGAPDLYRYHNPTKINPVYFWDLMELQTDIPQSMSAYMKYRYGNWIDNIPIINEPGIYSLNSLNESTQNCYRILSNNINEDYIIEYRKPYGKYENNLSVINDLNNNVKIKFDGGLLVYKINKNSDGKGNALTLGNVDDEIYIYRPYGTFFENGFPWLAPLNMKYSRDKINRNTNPAPFLFDGTDGGLSISEIFEEGSKLYFTLHSNKYTFIKYPYEGLLGVSLTPEILWDKIDKDCRYILQISTDKVFYNLVENDTLENTDKFKVNSPLEANTYYYLRVGVIGEFGTIMWTQTVIFKTAKDIVITNIEGRLCAGNTVKFYYDFWGNNINDNYFDLFLSDSQGGFSNGKKIGNLKSDKSGVITAVIPDDIISSRNYRFKIESSKDSEIQNITRKYRISKKIKPKILDIPEKICLNDVVKYTAGLDTNSSINEYIKYEWKVSNGNIVNIDTLNNTIEVLWRSVGNSSIKLKTINSECCSDSIEHLFYVLEHPEIILEGKNKVCANEETKYYQPIKSYYDFDIIVEGGIWNRKNKDTIVIIWDSTVKNGNIYIINKKEYYCDTTFIFPVIINQNPKLDIYGDFTYCKEIYYNYTINYDNIDTNNYDFIWNVDGGVLNKAGNYSNCRVMWYKDSCSISLLVIDKETNCSQNIIKNIIKMPEPDKPTIAYNEDLQILKSSKADFYQWIFENKEIENANEETYKPVKNGLYFVKIRNNNSNCEVISDPFLFNFLGIKNKLDNRISYKIENNVFKILLEKYIIGNFRIELFDIIGGSIYSNNYYNFFDDQIEIPISNLRRGTYILKITSNIYNENIKIIL